MGIFDVIKKNFTQGGVDVEIYTQPVISKSAPHAITIRVIAKGSTVQIKGVSVVLQLEELRAHMSLKNDRRDESKRSTMIAHTESNEVFTLNKGEVRDVPLTLSVNQSIAGGFTDAVSTVLDKFSNLMNHSMQTYNLVATVDVEGVALDPTSRVAVQVMDGGTTPPPTNNQPPTPPA